MLIVSRTAKGSHRGGSQQVAGASGRISHTLRSPGLHADSDARESSMYEVASGSSGIEVDLVNAAADEVHDQGVLAY